MSLDELEAKARETFERSGRYAALAVGSDTILDLIEKVRAGEELYDAIYEHQRESCSSQYDDFTEAARRWESLAHSPQES